jgi:hypothetical protein
MCGATTMEINQFKFMTISDANISDASDSGGGGYGCCESGSGYGCDSWKNLKKRSYSRNRPWRPTGL